MENQNGPSLSLIYLYQQCFNKKGPQVDPADKTHHGKAERYECMIAVDIQTYQLDLLLLQLMTFLTNKCLFFVFWVFVFSVFQEKFSHEFPLPPPPPSILVLVFVTIKTIGF
ncbi:hypothetical protein ACOSQ2_019235 [Xanthoceras sorbifolium]